MLESFQRHLMSVCSMLRELKPGHWDYSRWIKKGEDLIRDILFEYPELREQLIPGAGSTAIVKNCKTLADELGKRHSRVT